MLLDRSEIKVATRVKTKKGNKDGSSQAKAAPKSKAAETTAQAAPASQPGGRAADYALLRAPRLTEKSSGSGEGMTALVFRVPRRAAKDEIKGAIQRVFKVEVKSVRTVNVLGKLKRVKQVAGRQASFKKAYVTLKEGHSISMVEGL